MVDMDVTNVAQSGQSNLATHNVVDNDLTTFKAPLDKGDFSALAAYEFESAVKNQIIDQEAQRNRIVTEMDEARKLLENEIKVFAKESRPHFYENLPASFAAFGLVKDKMTVKPTLTREQDTNDLKLVVIYTLAIKCSTDTKLTAHNGYASDLGSITHTVTLTPSDKLIALATDHDNLVKQVQTMADELARTRLKLGEVGSVERAARAHLTRAELSKTQGGKALLDGIHSYTQV